MNNPKIPNPILRSSPVCVSFGISSIAGARLCGKQKIIKKKKDI